MGIGSLISNIDRLYHLDSNGMYVHLPSFCVYLNAKILSAALSATEIINALGFVVTIPGKIPASTTNRLSVPYTFVFRSTTAEPPSSLPSSLPILVLPIQWFALREAGDTGYYEMSADSVHVDECKLRLTLAT